MFWCLAHRLELAIKDALKSSLFSQIDEPLLRIYYLYEKAPKKCRELDRIVEELKECWGLRICLMSEEIGLTEHVGHGLFVIS